MQERNQLAILKLGKAQKVIKNLKTGDILEILTPDPRSIQDFKAFCEVTNCIFQDSQKENEPLRHQIRQAEHIHPHPEFHKTNVQNDLAVIHLNTSFNDLTV